MLSTFKSVYGFIKNEERNVKQPPKLVRLKLANFFQNTFNYYYYSCKTSLTNSCSYSLSTLSFFNFTTFRHRFYWQA